MFASADVEIHRHPVPFLLWINELRGVLGIDEPQVIPARPGPLRHRVGFPSGRLVRNGIGRREPFTQVGQWALARPRRLKVVRLR